MRGTRGKYNPRRWPPPSQSTTINAEPAELADEVLFCVFRELCVVRRCCRGLLSVVLRAGPEPLPQDKGATGTWQKLLKLQTTASAMHTTAHPDDEHGGMLAQLSRGSGARVSLLTLNRGESGDNAIGPELFDAVGLIRTEELLMAGRYYGLDRQYFTTAIDYGFSKRLEEALVKWGRENVLRDMVRDHPHRPAARADRAVPGQRARRSRQPRGGRDPDAGGVSRRRRSDGVSRADPRRPAAVAAAEALHGRRARERGLDAADRHRRVQPVARRLVSELRAPRPGVPAIAERRPRRPRRRGRRSRTTSARDRSTRATGAGDRETLASSTASTRRSPACSARSGVPRRRRPRRCSRAIDVEVRAAVAAFSMQNPSASRAGAGARSDGDARGASARSRAEPDAVFILQIKEQQFMDAINTALGDRLRGDRGGPARSCPDSASSVERRADEPRHRRRSTSTEMTLLAAAGGPDWQLPSSDAGRVRAGEPTRPPGTRFTAATLPTARRVAPVLRARVDRGAALHRCATPRSSAKPAAEPSLRARSRATRWPACRSRSIVTVRRREPHLPYGDELRELMVVPAVAVNVTPRVAIVPTAASAAREARSTSASSC